MTFQSQSSSASAPATLTRLDKARAGVGKGEESLTVGENQIQDHLRILKAHKSVG